MKNVKQKALTMVVATFLMQFFVVTVAANLVPVLQPTIVEYYGLHDKATLFNLIYTIGTIVPAFAAPIIPIIFNKIGFKAGYILGAILSGGGFLLMAFAPHGSNHMLTLVWFWVIAALFNIGNAIISSMGIPSLLNLWFKPEEKGRYLGIAFMGASAGNVCATLFFNFVRPDIANIIMLILGFGIMSIVIGCLVSVLLIRKPNDEEYKQIHADAQTASDANGAVEVKGMSAAEAFKSPMFFLFAIGLVFLGFYVAAMSTQNPTYIRNVVPGGADIYLKTSLCFAIFAIVGNLMGGFLFDKIKAFATICVGGCLALIAILSLIFGMQLPPIVFAFSICYGCSVFTYIVLPGYMTGFLFGDKAYGQILGICQMVFALGFSLGSFLFGTIVKALGWTPAWIIVLVFIVICYGCFLTATKIRLNLNKKEVK